MKQIHLWSCIFLAIMKFLATGFIQMSTITPISSRSVRRLKFTDPDFRRDFLTCESTVPVIIEGVYESKEVDLESWCDELIDRLMKTTVTYQIRGADGYIQVYENALPDFLEGVQTESCHESSWYLIDENIIKDVAPDMEDDLSVPGVPFGKDLFSLFPAAIRPSRSCLIIGGNGSRSFLHADPFEWVGSNILLEGRKLWTFIPPEADIKSYRLSPNAWGEDFGLAAGWQSDLDLYTMPNEAPVSDDNAGELYLNDGCAVSEDVWAQRICVVQKEGDLIIIPPKWWHQVIHIEPSVAVAGQYMNKRGADRVYKHIRECCNCSEEPFPTGFTEMSDKKKIESIIHQSLIHKHGQTEGEIFFKKIMKKKISSRK